MRGDMRGSLSGNLATMGPGVPYAIGAKFAHPDRPAVAIVGDGAMQMNGLAELITVARYWQEWSDPRLVVAVLHNNDLNQVTWEMRAMAGAPKFAESQTLPDVSYAGVRRHLRPPGHRGPRSGRDRPGLGEGVRRRPARRSSTCTRDPDVPPIPPHATFEQVKRPAKAMLRGDEDAPGVVRTGIKQKVQEFLPGRKDSEWLAEARPRHAASGRRRTRARGHPHRPLRAEPGRPGRGRRRRSPRPRSSP